MASNDEGQPEADISLESQQTQTNGISDAIEKVSSAEELAVDDKATSKRSLIDFQSLPTRSYLQQTVIPILEEGLTSLTQDRPSDPIGYLATYLLEHKGQYDSGTETLDSGSQVEDVQTQAKDSKLFELA